MRRRDARARAGRRFRAACLAAAVLAACAGGAASGLAAERAAGIEAIDGAVRRGVEFLLRSQNPDGSWGSARRTKGLNIYAPVPGAHRAFRAAVTALAASALEEAAAGQERVEGALDRAETWLEAHLPKLRRATPDTIYNCWGHAYGIQGLVTLWKRHKGNTARQQRILELVEGQVALLERYEAVDGGWGYLDFTLGSQKPSAITTSFTTATGLVALAEARDIGAKIPDRLARRAVAVMHRQQKPDFTYVYSESHKWRPMYYINRPGGSLGRSQACNLALRLWGDPKITDRVLESWLERLLNRNLWLDMGRKRPVPHESWFLVAGYFYYYGHYYAALCLRQLPAVRQGALGRRLAGVLLRFQEKDGSWWDYPFYDYHQQYGTAFAILSLVRCRAAQKAACPVDLKG